MLTQVPDKVQVIKNLEKDGLISLNLLSSPSLFILIKRNVPNLIAQQTIHETTTIEKMLYDGALNSA
jgi:hypothetical protein